jgi:hypothetical protein
VLTVRAFAVRGLRVRVLTLIKKENTIFLIYKEIQKEAVANSYMNNGFLIYD